MNQEEIRNAIRAILLPANARVQWARDALDGKRSPPPFIQDEVMNELRALNLICLRKISPVPKGAIVVVLGHGNVAVVEVTQKGMATQGV